MKSSIIRIIATALAALNLLPCIGKEKEPLVIHLWPDGAPTSNGITVAENCPEAKDGIQRIHNVTDPTITVYLAKKPNGVCLLDCPGGGYKYLAFNHEGTDMAKWLTSQGITFVVLKYRMPNGHQEVPLDDAKQAMRIIKSHAAEWGVNPEKIGVAGWSAGGHLASTLATHYDADTRPAFQVLFYPVITMREGTHAGTHNHLIGKTPTEEQVHLFSNHEQVTPDSPKAIIFLSVDDKLVPAAQNGIAYFNALHEAGVSATLHTYPTGGHGWGFKESFPYKKQWTDELSRWIELNVTAD